MCPGFILLFNADGFRAVEVNEWLVIERDPLSGSMLTRL